MIFHRALSELHCSVLINYLHLFCAFAYGCSVLFQDGFAYVYSVASCVKFVNKMNVEQNECANPC